MPTKKVTAEDIVGAEPQEVTPVNSPVEKSAVEETEVASVPVEENIEPEPEQPEIEQPKSEQPEVQSVQPTPPPIVPAATSPVIAPVMPGEYYPSQTYRPQQRGYNNYNFNGMVDNRVIPDANVPTEYMEGILDVAPDGFGYLRPKFIPSDKDAYISASQIRRFNLRPGDMVGGQVRAPKEKERYYGLLKVEKINDEDIDKMGKRINFSDLTPIYPIEQYKLETGKIPLSTRVLDLVSPIGKGQRGMIVSPPKAGKTFLMKDIASGITANYPEAHLMAVLVGERPEEVTDISRSIKGEVIASNFDEPPEQQTRVAEIAIDRARRLVEMGKDVVILFDSITRLARAYNLSIPSSGRTLSGGFDPAALFPPKKFFGAARKIENGGSLTIIGTCLVDTGSKMDDLIYEEFKGTGNMELHLSRNLAERRVYPAIDIQRSGTRQEELLYGKELYPKIITLRRMIDMYPEDQGRTERFLETLGKTGSNADFLKTLGKG